MPVFSLCLILLQILIYSDDKQQLTNCLRRSNKPYQMLGYGYPANL